MAENIRFYPISAALNKTIPLATYRTFLKSMREMRKAFKPQIRVDGGGLTVIFFNEVAGFQQP